MSDISTSKTPLNEQATALSTQLFDVLKPYFEAFITLAESASTEAEVQHVANAARKVGRALTGAPYFEIKTINGLPTQVLVTMRNGMPKMRGGIEQVCFARGAAKAGVNRSTYTPVTTATVEAVQVLEDAEPFAN